jgi:cytochrome c oxidase subunit 3
MSVSQKHPYHLVDPSPWPLLGSLGALASTIGGVMYMHYFAEGGTLLSLGLGMILYTMFVWWRDVICESTYEGHHTFVVQHISLCNKNLYSTSTTSFHYFLLPIFFL